MQHQTPVPQMLNTQTLRQSYRQLIYAFLLSVFCMHPVWADDTEIYFSPVSGADAQPNIVFLLDASYSMLSYDCANGRRRNRPCNDGSEFGNVNRLDRMNAALTRIINSVTDVNIGIMRFSNTFAGSRVIYPVRDIGQTICDGVPCDENSDQTGSVTSVRQELIDVIHDMVMQWSTPTVGGLLEAASYYAGTEVVYGKDRWHEADAHFDNEDGENSRVSHPDSYTGGQLVREPDCTDADLSDPACRHERIDGSPVYVSPIKNECQSNHLILVSDGAASNDNVAKDSAIALTGSCPTYVNDDGRCAVEIADYLATTDLRPDQTGIPGEQTVTTHTIGFNINSGWLKDIATEEDGYYEAESTDDLVDAVLNIIGNVEAVGNTFVAPGATVDQFSRLSHRKDVYLALFKPDVRPAWQGNLKRFDLLNDNLFDVNGNPAVKVETGRFEPNSRSFWSSEIDGFDVAIGGAASNLPHHSQRKAVTYTGTDEKNLFAAENELRSDNDLIDLGLATGENVAIFGAASQSTTSHSGAAGRAIDNNTSGRYRDGSVTHTNGSRQTQPWWQVALPQQTEIAKVVLHNREDCCSDRLNNVHIFISDNSLGDATVDQLQGQPGITHRFLPGVQGAEVPLTFHDVEGRFVRIQLEQPGALSLAEVQVFGVDAEAEAKEIRYVDWIRGMDVDDSNGNGDTTDNRFHIGDPLHSKPVIVNYGGDADNPDSVVFFGTNEGYLHAVDIRDGVEEFAFMPNELFSNIAPLYENQSDSNKVYGMDGDLTLWTEDSNKNGSIESGSGEHAYLYAGMRRGGSHYYALDVSNRANPKFMYSIPESDPDAFTELGQTWSKPILADIRVGSGDIRKVLIFGGGYDDSQDEKSTRIPDTKGRAIYIVDAEDGTVLWSGQPTGKFGQTTKVFPEMQYSIPSDIVVVDADGDGLASQFYVGDMGGQLWRFDIHNDGRTGTDLVDGGVIADFGENGTPDSTRRFFHAPDLSLSQFEGDLTLNIGIGSGYHAHPLNTTIEDSFFLIRYPFAATGNYGLATDSTATNFLPITIDDLYDATENLIGQGTPDVVIQERQNLSAREGWHIRMEGSGEKILGTSATLDHVVRFISYLPGSSDVGPCAPDIGKSFFWKVNIEDGTPVTNEESEEPRDRDRAHRRKEIPGGGLAPPVQTIFIASEDGVVTPTDVSGINILDTSDSSNLTKRWYWSEYPE